MAESTLNLPMAELRSDIGDYLGYGFGEENGDTAYDAFQLLTVNKALAVCLRRFYFQAQTQNMASPHAWSFLKPFATITLAEGEREVPLPDDFGGWEGQLYLTGDNGSEVPVDLVNPGIVEQKFAGDDDATGWPEFVALKALPGTTVAKSSRSVLSVYPIADDDYEFTFRYYIVPDCLTASHPYAYGGAQHVETIKAGAIAAAELHKMDVRGPREDYYQQCLAASIGYDRRMHPQYMGPNTDSSDLREMSNGFGRRIDPRRVSVVYGS